MFILRRVEVRGGGEGERGGEGEAEFGRLVTRILTFEVGRKRLTSNDKAEAERQVHTYSVLTQTVKREAGRRDWETRDALQSS